MINRIPMAVDAGRMLQGTVSVVAGGSSGIGRAVVERFVEHGSAVEFAANDPDGVAGLERDLSANGAHVRGSVVDASDPEQVRRFMDGVGERHGRLGALVNSVGIQRYGTVESTSARDLGRSARREPAEHVLDGKVRHAAAAQERRWGDRQRLVRPGVASQRNVVAYTASKGAIVAMTRAMAVDHAPDGVRKQCMPGSGRHPDAPGGGAGSLARGP